MGSSIAKGIAKIPIQDQTGLLIMLADQPLLPVAYYQELLLGFNENRCKVVATKYENKSGVPAVFHTDLASELRQLNQDFGAGKIIKKYDKELLVLHPLHSTADIDTFDEYKDLLTKIDANKEP